jgi:peptidase A4-like protein
MRKPFRAGGVAVGALAAALTAGAFAFAPASATVTTATTVTGSKVPASIQPGTPLRAVGGGQGAAVSASALGAVTNLQALNWAGYAASRGTTTFRFVSAEFTVPTVDCTGVTAASGAWSGHWIGLDGFRTSSSTVEQVGVIAGCTDSTTPVYQAFWEMFPNAANSPTSIHIQPGDAISMSVYYNRSTRQFTLTFSDTSTGQSFTRTRACPAGATCRRNSAEAISEAPSDGSTGAILPLANFNIAHFASVSITNTAGTHRGGLVSSFWNTSKITQVAGNGTNFSLGGTAITQGSVLDIPTSLTNKRTFNAQWQPANNG